MDACGGLARETISAVHIAKICLTGGGQPDLRPDSRRIRSGSLKQKAHPGRAGREDVVVEERLVVSGGDGEVKPTIIIEVRDGEATAVLSRSQPVDGSLPPVNRSHFLIENSLLS